MKKFIFTCLFLYPLLGACQFDNCYYIKLWRIGHFSFDNMDSLATNVDKLLKLEDQYRGGNMNHYFLLAELYARKGDSTKKMDCVRKCLLNGGELDDLKDNIAFSAGEIKTVNEWFRNEVLPARDNKYMEWIDQLYGFDQYNRAILNRNDPFFKEYLSRVDSFTAVSFRTMILQHGFPKKSAVGNARYGKLFVIFLHLFIDYEPLYPFFSERLKEAIFTADIDPEYYGAFIDRHQLSNKKEGQLYGCYNLGQNGFSDIKDITHVDERRAAIGLAPLKEIVQYPPYYGYLIPANYHYNIDNICH